MSLRRSVALLAALLAACRGGEEGAPRDDAGPPLRSADGAFLRPFAGDGGAERFAVDPKDPESLYLGAQLEFGAGDFAQAADHLRASLRLAPSAKAWHALGDALMVQGRFSEATDAFREAVRLEPTKQFSWARLGRCLVNSGRPAEAVEAYHKALELKPGDLATARDEVEALLAAHRDDDAVAALERIAAADPKGSARDLKLLGQIRSRQERWGEAVAALRRAHALQPDADVQNQIGEALTRMGDLPGARDAFQEAARLDAADPFAWELVAEIEAKLSHLDAARAAFEASLRVKDRSGPHLGLGRLALKGRDAAEARRQLDAAMVAATGETPAEVRELGAFALEIGDAPVAVKLLEMLAAEPDAGKDAALQRALAGAYQARRAKAPPQEQVELARKVKEACERARAAAPKGDTAKCPAPGG